MFTGIVEGFYGRPYSHSQRDVLLGHLARIPSPAYLYAPKNDRFHRLEWRLPYPAEEWERLAATIARASDKGVGFLFGVSPRGFRKGEEHLLARKASRALDAGAAGIAVLFDDIPDSATAELASAQVRFARDALSGIECRVLVCPSVYCLELLDRYGGGSYLEEWRASCPADWQVLWTGDGVVSREIDGRSAARAAELLGRRPVIWDNLLADDYCLRRTYLGSLRGRTASGCSYLLNPSRIFPVALHGAMELAAASGAPREWPPELGPHVPGWELLAEFHWLPWGTGETGAELLGRVSDGFRGTGEEEVLQWLSGSTESLSELCASLESVEGGFDLLPLVLDLQRFLSILARSIRESESGSRGAILRRLLLERLPYEHPLAATVLGLLDGEA